MSLVCETSHSSAPDCALSLSPGKVDRKDGNKHQNIPTYFLGCFFSFYHSAIGLTINVLWPSAVEPLPECPNVLWSEIQMEKLVLERWETGDCLLEIFEI